MKGGRQAKLLAKENQAKKRAEKLFTAFNKESLKKLKDKILPAETKTPVVDMQTGHNFSESAEASPNKFGKTFTKSFGRKSKQQYYFPTIFWCY